MTQNVYLSSPHDPRLLPIPLHFQDI